MNVGQTVRVHPATDLFMRGVVTAVVTKVGRKWVHLFHPLSKTNHKVSHAFAKENLEVQS